MKSSISVVVTVVLIGMAVLAGCGGGNNGGGGPQLPATHLLVTASAAATAGTAFHLNVTALDASNNPVTTYSGTVQFTSSDPQAVLPTNSTLTNGTGTFSVTLKTVGSQTVTATDTVTASITGTTTTVTVSAGPASLFTVTTMSNGSAAGTSFNFTVTVFDAFNNIATTYTGTVKFTSTDPQAVLPAPSTLTNGTQTFQATLKTSGNQMITATDKATASITGSLSIAISAGPVARLSITAPANAVTDEAFAITASALDAFNNIATSYTGTVNFTSSDMHADLPPPSSPLPNGTATFPVGLKTTGPQTITATDAVTPALTATSSINVSAAGAANPVPLIYQPLSPDAIPSGGASFALTVSGTGFVPGSVVDWNGQALATQFVSQSKLTATVPPANVASFNTAAVTVFNPAPQGGTSNVVFFETTRATSAVAYNAPASLATSGGPLSVATGDFNGDGKLDLAVAENASPGAVSIYLGNGDGTFRAAVNYPTGSNSSFVAVGDFNGDGKLDLAVANETSPGTVSILLGNGDGTFQAAVNYGVGVNPVSVAVGDFDGDGKLDLAVATQSNSFSILLGNGDGTFQPAFDYPVPLSQPQDSVVVGDFNGDGKLDLALTDGGGTVTIYLGNGDGTFQPGVNYTAGSGATPLVVADFNGDGKLDLATGTPGGGTVSIFLGNGDGTFQPAVGYPAGNANSVAVGDFNGDGKLDLAVTNSPSGAFVGSVGLLLGNGDGTFQPVVTFPLPSNHTALAVGDFNSDGRLDLAVVDSNNSAVSVLLQPSLVSGPDAILSATSLTFPLLIPGNTSPAQSFTLTNYGTQTLDISGIAPPSNFTETDNCGSPATVAAGAACTINVVFAPSVVGNINSALIITDNAPGSPQMVALSGLAVTPTTATLTPPMLSFHCTGATDANCGNFPQNTTLMNTGTAPLYVNYIVAGGNFFQTNNCPAMLPVGQSCTITVHFLGGKSGHVFGGTLSVNDTTTASPQTVALTGEFLEE